jgi:hypothetical protein
MYPGVNSSLASTRPEREPALIGPDVEQLLRYYQNILQPEPRESAREYQPGIPAVWHDGRRGVWHPGSAFSADDRPLFS